MAFLAPLLIPIVGEVGAGLITTGLSLAASYGVGVLMEELNPKSSASSGASGARLSATYATNEPREVPVGLCASAGRFKYQNSYGPNGNDYLQLVYVLGDLPCTSLETMYVAGNRVTLGSWQNATHASGRTVAEYPDAMWVEFHDGAWNQAADADLVAHAQPASPWPTTYRGRGVCYVRVTLKADNKLYKGQRPEFLFVFKGAKLYDWRKDSTVGGSGSHRWRNESTYEWTDNPEVIRYNFVRGITVNNKRLCGMNAPAISAPIAEFTAASNACDEIVTKKDGSTEKRYTFNGIIRVDADNASVLREINTATAGQWADCCGVFRPLPGVARTPVMHITDVDIMAPDEVRAIPKRTRGDLLNSVYGEFHDPSQMYAATALPPRVSPDDIAADGDATLDAKFPLSYVTSGTQGQRCLEIFRRRNRYQGRYAMTLRPAFVLLEPGDWVTWTSDRYGFINKTFQITQAKRARDLRIALQLQEVSSDIFAFTSSVDELDPKNPGIVAAGASTFTTLNGFDLDPVTVTGKSSARRPGLRATWTPVTDTSVVEILIQYRKQGDTVALETRAVRPSEGELTWLGGVQGGVTYEARALPITRPERSVEWTSWTSTAQDTQTHVVDVAAVANGVPPGAITPAMISEQTKFNLFFEFQKSAAFQGLDAQMEDIAGVIADVNDAILKLGTTVNDPVKGLATKASATTLNTLTTRVTSVETTANGKNRVFRQATTPSAVAIGDAWFHTGQGNKLYLATAKGTANWVAADDTRIGATQTLATSTASLVTALTSRVGTAESKVFDQATAINGIKARRTLGVNANGNVALIDIAGNVFGTTMTFVGDTFYFVHPSVNGGKPTPLLAIKTIDGVPKFAFNGDMIVNSILAGSAKFASLKAISSNFADMTCTGVQRSGNGRLVIDWNKPSFKMDFV